MESELLAPEVAKVIVGSTCVGAKPATESCDATKMGCERMKNVGSCPRRPSGTGGYPEASKDVSASCEG